MVRSTRSRDIFHTSELCIEESLAVLGRIQIGMSETSRHIQAALDALKQSHLAIQQTEKLLNGHHGMAHQAETSSGPRQSGQRIDAIGA